MTIGTQQPKPGFVFMLLAASALVGCGPKPVATSETGGADFNNGIAQSALTTDNGLSANGLSANGLSANGLSANGLSANGLSANGLFPTWFNQDATLNAALMSYVYRCAAPAGTSMTWTNLTTGVSYTWSGVLGLAPSWVAGSPPTVAEQQVVTACLAAHVNGYGVHVPIALEGRTAKGVQLAIGTGELTTYSVREAAFFGNLFNGDGVFAAIDHSIWANPLSSARACAFDNTASGALVALCKPMVFVGSASSYCTPDKSKTFYESCTYNGKTYQPLVTRLQPSSVFKCGDGVCQFTEMCGTKSEWWQCKDCGACPAGAAPANTSDDFSVFSAGW